MKTFEICVNYQDVTQTSSEQMLLENGASRLAKQRVTTKLQFVKKKKKLYIVLAKCSKAESNKRGMSVILISNRAFSLPQISSCPTYSFPLTYC